MTLMQHTPCRSRSRTARDDVGVVTQAFDGRSATRPAEGLTARRTRRDLHVTIVRRDSILRCGPIGSSAPPQHADQVRIDSSVGLWNPTVWPSASSTSQ